MEEDRLRVSKDTQKFVADLADLPPEKHRKVLSVLEALEKQQGAEAELENKRGWRYMWQRTPKPFLLMLGYLVFLAPVGSVGYHSLSYIPDTQKNLYLFILLAILILPLCVVFYLSYNYMKHTKLLPEKEEVEVEKIPLAESASTAK